MNNSRLEWKVGVFVFIGLALLGGLALQFSKGPSFFRQTSTIKLEAANVGGLKLHASVLMAGVEIGRVSDIRLAPGGTNVIISLRLLSPFQVHKDARFAIEQSGFLGDQYVAIIPTRNVGDVYQPGDVAHAEPPFNMQEVARSAAGFIQRIDETALKLNEAISDVRRMVLNEQTLTNLSAAVLSLRAASDRALGTLDNLDSLISSNKPALASAGSNLVMFSEKMNDVAGGLNGIVETNREAIHNAVKNIESSSDVLKTVMDDLQAGKGLAGNLLKNEQLAASVSQIASNLSITTSNLNRLGLWGILRSHKPPASSSPPREAARPLSAPKNLNE